MKRIVRRGSLQAALKQATEDVTDLQQLNLEIQPLRQYLGLLRMNVNRYEYLKESGAPDAILYVEKGRIDRQVLFLSKACTELKK